MLLRHGTQNCDALVYLKKRYEPLTSVPVLTKTKKCNNNLKW